MHVVMLTNAIAPDKLGGLERYVRELSRSLVEAGCNVTVLAKSMQGRESQELSDDGVRIIRHAVPDKTDPLFAWKYPWQVARGIRHALSKAPADAVVHAHFPVAALVPALLRRPYAYTLHAPVYRELLVERQGTYKLPTMFQKPAVQSLRAAEGLVLRRASRVITLSRFMRDEVEQLTPSRGGHTELIPGGIDTVRFSPAASHVSPAMGEAWPRIFTARRLTPRTGVQQLVAAMPLVLEQFPDAQLLVAGAGEQRASIEKEVADLGLARFVRLLGRVSEADLIDHYRAADLVVTPTQELEGFGLATAEALACGTPCLVTPVGANPEVAGLLSPTLVGRGRDSASLAQDIIRLCSDRVALAALKRSARAAVHPVLSWDAVVAQHLDLYQNMRRERQDPDNGGRVGS